MASQNFILFFKLGPLAIIITLLVTIANTPIHVWVWYFMFGVY